MSETVGQNSRGVMCWSDIPGDLKKHGVAGIALDSQDPSCNANTYTGTLSDGTRFSMLWVPDQLTILTIEGMRAPNELENAFSAVLEQMPICRYQSTARGTFTTEWNSGNPEGRLALLERSNLPGFEKIA